ncbi:MAG: hypothetical protein HZA93_29305 [Verrucomicrobia bacterium]|nr:hypothetical protein [Verrucomicrobiota bacterium]
MSPAELERLRFRLLETLREVAGTELPVSTLLQAARLAGFRSAEPATIAAELSYLADKGFVAAADKALSPEMREWRVTAAGRDYLASRGI